MDVFRSLPLRTRGFQTWLLFLSDVFYIYPSAIKAEGVNQREDFVHRVQRESVLYTEPWQGMTSIWSATQFVLKQGEGKQATCGEHSPEGIGSWAGAGSLGLFWGPISEHCRGGCNTWGIHTMFQCLGMPQGAVKSVYEHSLESHYSCKWTNQLVQ